MIAFRDRKRRLWTARLDVAAAVRMRDLANVDVMALALGREAIVSLTADPGRLVDALFAIFLPSCESRGVSDREFGKALPAVDLADLFYAEVGEFFGVPELMPGRPKKAGKGDPVTAEMLWGNVWWMAGIAGVDPGGRTLGELVAMADAKRKHDWAQSAWIIATVETFAGFGRRRAVQPAERDPTGGLGAGRKSNQLKVSRKTLHSVAAIFMRN